MSGVNTIFLVSTLSVLKPLSFTRQLLLLKKAFEQRGMRCFVIGRNSDLAELDPGPLESGLSNNDVLDIPVLSWEYLEPLIENFHPKELIVLGYPGDMPFLREVLDLQPRSRKVLPKLYFWAQCSSVPQSGSYGDAIVIPLTKISRDFVMASGHAKIEQVVPHGLDTDLFKPLSGTEKSINRKRFHLPDKILIGSIGANSKRKRFDLLCNAFSKVLKKYENVHLIIKTGQRQKSGGFDLGKIVREVNIDQSTRIIAEELTEEDVAALVGSLDIYVQCSEWEGFGIPVVEAMASAVPVVCNDAQGPGELLPYRDFLVKDLNVLYGERNSVKKADTDSITHSLEKVLTNMDYARELALRAREIAVEQFDYRKVARDWIDIIRR